MSSLAKELASALTAASCNTTPGTSADLIFAALSISAREPSTEPGDEDSRSGEIVDLLMAATPEVRTRAAQSVWTLGEVLTRLHRAILSAKGESEDPDVYKGDAEITPDGWLRVTMDGNCIGLAPYNPERGAEDAQRMAEEMLSEHVRLHVARSAEPEDAPARLALVPEEPRVEPDGRRAMRLVVQ